MPQTRLDPRDHLLARHALTESVAELAKKGLEGEPLRQRAEEIAKALRAGLLALSAVAEFGSTRQSMTEDSCLIAYPVPHALLDGSIITESDEAFDALMAAVWPRIPIDQSDIREILVLPLIYAAERNPGAGLPHRSGQPLKADWVRKATGPLTPVRLSPRRNRE